MGLSANGVQRALGGSSEWMPRYIRKYLFYQFTIEATLCFNTDARDQSRQSESYLLESAAMMASASP